jgi:hypothetical protein
VRSARRRDVNAAGRSRAGSIPRRAATSHFAGIANGTTQRGAYVVTRRSNAESMSW